jgi:hypothetical protein
MKTVEQQRTDARIYAQSKGWLLPKSSKETVEQQRIKTVKQQRRDARIYAQSKGWILSSVPF